MTDPLSLPGPFWLVGCGNMAGAMLAGWLAADLDPTQITVIRPSGGDAAPGVRVLTHFPEDEVPALVLLGFKPKTLDEVAPRLGPALDPQTILISVLAGVEQATLRACFPAPRTIVKAMPNLPVRIRKGVTNLFSDSAEPEARLLVGALMGALGQAEWFDDEAHFALAGHLTAAAPAFLFRFIEALATSAFELGLPRERAMGLTLAMARGAGALAAVSPDSPAELARRVASPGGTTEAGLEILDAKDGLRGLMLRSLAASLQRGEEMARAARKHS